MAIINLQLYMKQKTGQYDLRYCLKKEQYENIFLPVANGVLSGQDYKECGEWAYEL
jgi:hypothetical protein